MNETIELKNTKTSNDEIIESIALEILERFKDAFEELAK